MSLQISPRSAPVVGGVSFGADVYHAAARRNVASRGAVIAQPADRATKARDLLVSFGAVAWLAFVLVLTGMR